MPKSNKPRSAPRASHPFAPIVFDDSRILILGSFPSLQSFENNFYYAHPRNQFWPILSAVYGIAATTQEKRIALLRKARIALWDVIESCERTNSADTNLANCVPNPIDGLIRDYPAIRLVCLTGGKAAQLYRRHFSHTRLPAVQLPSPSPAYAAMRFEAKCARYRRVLLDSAENRGLTQPDLTNS